MSALAIGGFLALHGLITAAIGFSAVSNTGAKPMQLPPLFAWWPGPFWTSCLFEGAGLVSGAQLLGGLVWIASGALIIGGALGWLGIGPLETMRVQLLVAGAAVGMLALVA